MTKQCVDNFENHLEWRKGLVKNIEDQERSLDIINESLRIEKISKLKTLISKTSSIATNFSELNSKENNLIFGVNLKKIIFSEK